MDLIEPTTDPRVFARKVSESLQAEPPTAEALADLFSLSTSGGRLARPLIHTLQKALLKRTVDEARQHTAYYGARDAYATWEETTHVSPPNLTSWPILDRAEVAAHHEEFLATNVEMRSISHTSGTTGTPLDVYRSVEEVAFVNRYFSRMFASVRKLTKSLPLILSFPNLYHGVPLPLPSLGKVFVGGVTDDTLIQDAAKLLSRQYRIAGHDEHISIVSGLLFHVQFFTSYLLEQGVDLRKLRVSTINVTGGFASRHWRRFLAESWGAHVNDRFSLTEVVGGASRNEELGGFVLDPHVYGEVVDVDELRPIDEGIGLLLLTNLNPFVQMQPLLRYRTGDLVRVWRAADGATPVFEFLGKEKNCIRWRRGSRPHWLIFSAQLNDILSALPDVRINEWFSNVHAAADRTVGSLPLLRVDTRELPNAQLELCLHLELRYAPHCFVDRARELSQHIVGALCSAPGTDLGALVAEGAVHCRVQFHSPGALDARIEIKI